MRPRYGSRRTLQVLKGYPQVYLLQSQISTSADCGATPKRTLTSRPRYLVVFTVGYRQGDNINAAVKKFSGNFTVILFHYDGQITKWDKFTWSKQAIHISVPKQTKWWYAKRFLHPDIVAPYDYIFLCGSST
ncbi:hypothetical protein MLD38_008433 [Melastoma candidum]|uniref:Uncharacterized protein n=1 Tax=Melastoma candidum TaxID=119954 RepID=A0ACB9RYL7_9MYRT|nr:hypothetical protein MLD38_008433 [Melastoma candidum]